MKEPTFLVVGQHEWNRRTFERHLRHLPGDWHYLDTPADLHAGHLRQLAPRKIFFLHWSRIVPEAITGAYECICFHMTDLPFGRGGTPLQNLIARGIRETKLTAFRMTGEIDAGPVYLKMPLGLEGRAQDIYERASDLSATMIRRILADDPAPEPQSGEAVVFRRRTPDESELPRRAGSPVEVHDFIRMLDADGYPHAFVDWGALRIEFRNASLHEGRVEATVTIRIRPQEGE